MSDDCEIQAWWEEDIARLERELAAALAVVTELERDLAAAIANIYEEKGRAQREGERVIAAFKQRDKAIAHLVNMLHAADELADCVGITKWDTEIDMARIFLKECGK